MSRKNVKKFFKIEKYLFQIYTEKCNTKEPSGPFILAAGAALLDCCDMGNISAEAACIKD